MTGATAALQWVTNFRDAGGTSIIDATRNGRAGFAIDYTTGQPAPPRPTTAPRVR